MALITKTMVTCNKCGKETVWDGANVIVLDEEFYLCDECLERLLNWLSVKTEDTSKPTITFERKTENKDTGKRAPYVMWDEYNLNKLLDMLGQNKSTAECAEAFCVSANALRHLFYRIEHAEVGSMLYQYKSRLERLNMMRRGKREDEE